MSGAQASPRRRGLHSLRANSAWVLGLIASCQILGAGVFKLPAEVARVGWVPVVLMGVATWSLTRRAYHRLVSVTSASGARCRSYGDILAVAGAGRAGRWLGVLGATAYIVPANIGYSTLASVAVVWVARCFDGLPAAVTLIVATVGVSVGLAARWCGSLAGRLRLAGLWGAGPALASLVTPALGTWRWLAGLAIYTFGAMVATSGSAGSASDQRGGGLDAAHRTAVVNLLIQVALMAVLAALAVWVVAAGDAGHVTPVAFAGFNSNLLISAGTLIFAGVGCLTPLAAYPSMSDPGFRKRVVNRAMWFAAALKTSWILLAVMVVAPQDLLAHSQLDQTSAQGVAGLISTFGTGWMGVAAAVAAVLAFGIGLTSAGAGFSESLALEALSARAHLSRRAPAEFPSQAHHQLVQRMVIAVCAVAAGILNMVAVFASLADALLAIGGLAGGGILVFICGAIAEPDPRRRSRARIEALAAGAGAGTLTTLVVFHTVGDAIRVALTVGAGVVSLLIVYLIHWATTSAPVRRPARALVVVLNASKQLLARETQSGALVPPDRRLVVPAGNVDVFGTTVEESLGLTGPACLLTFTSADTPAVAGVSAAHAIATGGAAGSTGERSLTLERATAAM